jgi:hypothetical protein
VHLLLGFMIRLQMFHEYFSFYSPIREYKKMELPDLKCSQNLLLVIYKLSILGSILYSTKTPPKLFNTLYGQPSVHCNSHHGSIFNLQLVLVLILGLKLNFIISGHLKANYCFQIATYWLRYLKLSYKARMLR